VSRSPGKVKLTGMQKKGFKSDWLGHAKREELDESALNTTKTSKVCKFSPFKIQCLFQFFQHCSRLLYCIVTVISNKCQKLISLKLTVRATVIAKKLQISFCQDS